MEKSPGAVYAQTAERFLLQRGVGAVDRQSDALTLTDVFQRVFAEVGDDPPMVAVDLLGMIPTAEEAKRSIVRFGFDQVVEVKQVHPTKARAGVEKVWTCRSHLALRQVKTGEAACPQVCCTMRLAFVATGM
jgi:hypothetical protein